MGKKSRIKRDKLHFDQLIPCPTCPFRKDVPFDYEYLACLQNLVHMVSLGGSHSCHYTDRRADLPDNAVGRKNTRKIQHCAGALIMLKREGIAPLKMTKTDIDRVFPMLDSTVEIYSLREFLVTYFKDLTEREPEAAEKTGVKAIYENFRHLEEEPWRLRRPALCP
jgi:hypothetical protein